MSTYTVAAYFRQYFVGRSNNEGHPLVMAFIMYDAMRAQAYNSGELNDIFQDLINGYSLDCACAFLQSCWFWPEKAVREEHSLERMIYTQGNLNEVYTAYERRVIGKFDQQVVFCSYRLSSINKMVKCKTLALSIQGSAEPLKDAIALMKIFNKAFAGFNVFLFVCEKGLFLGCSCIKSSSIGMDCVISPIISHEINWDALYDTFLFRNDSSNFYDYYSGVVGSILSILDCYSLSEKEDKDIYKYRCTYDYDSDALEDYRHFGFSGMIDYHQDTSEKLKLRFDKEEFWGDVQDCMEELSFIVANRINPLELLFEAQKVYEENRFADFENTHSANPHPAAVSEDDMHAFNMLDDPIALMQMLKRQRGI